MVICLPAGLVFLWDMAWRCYCYCFHPKKHPGFQSNAPIPAQCDLRQCGWPLLSVLGLGIGCCMTCPADFWGLYWACQGVVGATARKLHTKVSLVLVPSTVHRKWLRYHWEIVQWLRMVKN